MAFGGPTRLDVRPELGVRVLVDGCRTIVGATPAGARSGQVVGDGEGRRSRRSGRSRRAVEHHDAGWLGAGHLRRRIERPDTAVEHERPPGDVEDACGPRRRAFDAEAVDSNALLVDRHHRLAVGVDRELERDLVDVGEIEVSRVDAPARAHPIGARPERLACSGSPAGDLDELGHGVLRSGSGCRAEVDHRPADHPGAADRRRRVDRAAVDVGDRRRRASGDALDDVGDRRRLPGASDRDLGLAMWRADHDVHMFRRLRRSVSSWPLVVVSAASIEIPGRSMTW